MKSIIDAHIVPWALPKEDIPITIKWNQNIDFTKIEITLTSDMEIKELINVGSYEVKNNAIEIYEIKKISGVECYFGFIIASKIIFEKLKINREIRIKFYKDDEIIHEKILNARIFRPLLQVIDYPEELIFSGEGEKELPLVLRFTGFGDILLEITGRINGKLVTKGKSFLYEVIKRVIELGDIENNDYGGIEISPEFVQKTKQDILLILGDPPEEIIDSLIILKGSIVEDEFIKTVEDLLEKRIEDVLLGMVFDLIKKNPINNVKLGEGETSVLTVLEAPLETLELYVKYKDIINNEYDIINISIKLKTDKKNIDKIRINMPIKIEKWEHEPFINVSEINIEKS